MVGALLVVGDEIVAEGYTSPYGGPHAEVNAISKISDPSLLEKATLYVSLEPCAHFGKTPPCANLIVHSKIPKVVIGALDTFSEVNGRGIAHLKKNGIEVITGVLDKECREINRRFFTFHEKKRPYIILKWAETKDGFMDKLRASNENKINWITSPETKSLVHLWRSQEMGILVGRKTIENDNPKLDVRLVGGRNPIRIVIDPDLRLEIANWTHSTLSETLIFNKNKTKQEGNITYIGIKDMSLKKLLAELYTREIQSILVEGGAFTLNEFIKENLWDEARVLTGKTEFKKGISAPKILGEIVKKEKLGDDGLTIYRNK
jgi:diaminohydroxyphosphoribosylaminopyrimidine deaminase/5-amino-6-(5-phosphoribosylamino)uracil reductase